MARKTKQDWLREGLHTLAEQGATALKIDTLTARMGMTKGSFYHHFANFHDYKISLLEWIEQEGTLRIIAITEEEGTPIEKFDRLLHLTTDEPNGLEVAVRAWALQDDIAWDYQERIDQQRLAYVDQLCQELLSNTAQAHRIAKLLYSVYIGCMHTIPPIKDAEMLALFTELKQAFKFFGDHDEYSAG